MLCRCCRKREAVGGYLKCSTCLQGVPKRLEMSPEQREAKRASERLKNLARKLRRGERPRLKKPTPGALALVQQAGLLDEVYVPPLGLTQEELSRQSKRSSNQRYREKLWPNVRFDKQGKPIT